MIQLKNSAQLSVMKEAGRITGEALLIAREMVREGVSTKEIDTAIRNYIEKCGALPSFLGYGGFPGSACISINDEVIHGIPSEDKILMEGDIVKIDVGAFYGGFHGDAARTIPVGRISEDAQRLISVTRDSFFAGLACLRSGNRTGDIGSSIQKCVESAGFSVVRRYVGHGVGKNLHEEPELPNFGFAGHGVRLCAGMTLAVEPMVNAGASGVYELEDGWTVKTSDGSLSGHYENTVALTSEGAVVFTLIDKEW